MQITLLAERRSAHAKSYFDVVIMAMGVAIASSCSSSQNAQLEKRIRATLDGLHVEQEGPLFETLHQRMVAVLRRSTPNSLRHPTIVSAWVSVDDKNVHHVLVCWVAAWPDIDCITVVMGDEMRSFPRTEAEIHARQRWAAEGDVAFRSVVGRFDLESDITKYLRDAFDTGQVSIRLQKDGQIVDVTTDILWEESGMLRYQEFRDSQAAINEEVKEKE